MEIFHFWNLYDNWNLREPSVMVLLARNSITNNSQVETAKKIPNVSSEKIANFSADELRNLRKAVKEIQEGGVLAQYSVRYQHQYTAES